MSTKTELKNNQYETSRGTNTINNSMNYSNSHQTTCWKADPTYTSQVH
jgi:hypothetical protein